MLLRYSTRFFLHLFVVTDRCILKLFTMVKWSIQRSTMKLSRVIDMFSIVTIMMISILFFFFCIYILKLIKWYIFNMLTFFYVYYINRGLRMSHYSLPFNQAHEKKHSNISVDTVETHLVNFNICS